MTETWLTKYHFNLEILPNDYFLYRRNKRRRCSYSCQSKCSIQSTTIVNRPYYDCMRRIMRRILCGVYVHPTSHHLILMMSLLILIPFQKPEILSLEISDIDWYSHTHGILLLKIFATFYLKIILASLSHRLRIYMETFLT